LKRDIETKAGEVSISSSKAASEAKDEAVRASTDLFLLLKQKNEALADSVSDLSA
jgi:hypothetical protein